MELRNKRIFLTGGTGFFGKSLLSWFPVDGEVMILSRSPEAFCRKHPEFDRFQFIKGDIRDFQFPAGKFDYVIHAATDSCRPLAEDEAYDTIVNGTRRVLEFSKTAGVERLMMISSGAVYGVQPPDLERMPEDFPCNPVTPYGKGKFLAEQLCRESGLTVLLPRCFAFVGPYLGLNIHFAIGNFIRDCLENRPIIIKGDGTPLRSYLHTDDLVNWLWRILLHGEGGRSYNVGADRAISIAGLAQLVRQVAGTHNEIQILTPSSGKPPLRYIPNIDRVRRELGVEVKIELEDAIRRTLGFHRREASGKDTGEYKNSLEKQL